MTAQTEIRPLGVDVSHRNGEVNWRAVRTAGATFAFIRATQGEPIFVDNRFVENWENSKRAGVLRGAYHYFTLGDPQRQAKHFAQVLDLRGDSGEIWPVVNVKATGIKMAELLLFVQEFERITNSGLIIYTSPGFWGSYSAHKTAWAVGSKLWMAQYPHHMPIEAATTTAQPSELLPWNTWEFWQFTAKGEGGAFGIGSKNVDLSVWNGTHEEFVDMYGAATPELEGDSEYPKTAIVLPARLNVRQIPTTRNNSPTNQLLSGERVTILKIRQAGSDTWAACLTNKNEIGWSAIEYNGQRYMELIWS